MKIEPSWSNTRPCADNWANLPRRWPWPGFCTIPIVTAPIIGPRTIEQLESTLRATEITLDEETLKKLDEIFPGPGGEAPAAYAW